MFESLARLVAHHLVVADDMKEATRYRLLDTIRQYGEERLVELDETDTLRARHADYYAEFAGVVRDHSYGPEQVEWATRLGREHDNLLAAMVFAIDTQDLERAMRLLCQLPYVGLQVNDPVAFDPEAVLALPGADDHPGSSVALVLAGFEANSERRRCAARWNCAIRRSPSRHVSVPCSTGPSKLRWRTFVRSSQATRGVLDEAAAHALEAARQARERELPAVAAMMLGLARAISRGTTQRRHASVPRMVWHSPNGQARRKPSRSTS